MLDLYVMYGIYVRGSEGWTEEAGGKEERYGIVVVEEFIRRSRNDFMTSE